MNFLALSIFGLEKIYDPGEAESSDLERVRLSSTQTHHNSDAQYELYFSEICELLLFVVYLLIQSKLRKDIQKSIATLDECEEFLYCFKVAS